jgi:hypothetical protein
VTGELISRLTTAALPFRLAPWTYDSASPALKEQGRHLTADASRVRNGVITPQALS